LPSRIGCAQACRWEVAPRNVGAFGSDTRRVQDYSD
jgi:hypothetical protein